MMGASGGATAEPLYIESLFSTYLYTGNGSTQTITNGIDLAGKGGMVWIKARTSPFDGDHNLYDTSRGVRNYLITNLNSAQATANPGSGLTAFTSSGFSLGSPWNNENRSDSTYVSWTFREQPKFFDVVTYTGDGTNGRAITHSLGAEPGLIIVKRTDGANNWAVYHRSLPSAAILRLNTTDAQLTGNPGFFGNGTIGVAPTSTNFTVGLSINGVGGVAGGSFVAYLFAHDTSTDGLIQCGSFTTDGSGNATVNLGWEPQFVLIKSSSATNNWIIGDNMRGAPASGGGAALAPNLSNAEFTSTTAHPYLTTATGFKYDNDCFGAATPPVTYIYLAIRRPNKPPTSGTQVYNAIARTGTGAAATVTGVGFAPDLGINSERYYGIGAQHWWTDRLRGIGVHLPSNGTDADAAITTGPTAFGMDGWSLGTNASWNYLNAYFVTHFFRRAPGFFDVVCYTGNGGVGQQWPHSLGVQPELIIQKARSTTGNWVVAALAIEGPSSSPNGLLNTTGNLTSATYGLSCKYSTATTFYTDFNTGNTNVSGTTYVAYLFASLPGISKVFSYTGNGSSQTINCGFTNGARFVLIKRSDNTGNWLVADTARGLVSGNDPVLYLNSTAAEVTNLDWIDPDSTGFTVVQEATANANVNNATYIGLAIA